MVFEHYWLAILASAICFVITLTIVGIEIFRFRNRKDNSFWNDMLSLAMIYVFFNMGVYSADQASRGTFAYNTENYEFRGLTSVTYLRKESGIDQVSCVVDESIESQRCLFLLNAENTETYSSMIYISNDKGTIVRSGKWPFAKTAYFEPFKNHGN